MAKQDAHVVFCDLPTSNGEKVANEMKGNATFIPADVTSETDIKNLAQQIEAKYGKLDVLINCAGLGIAHVIYNFEAKRAHLLSDYQKLLMVRFLYAKQNRLPDL